MLITGCWSLVAGCRCWSLMMLVADADARCWHAADHLKRGKIATTRGKWLLGSCLARLAVERSPRLVCLKSGDAEQPTHAAR